MPIEKGGILLVKKYIQFFFVRCSFIWRSRWHPQNCRIFFLSGLVVNQPINQSSSCITRGLHKSFDKPCFIFDVHFDILISF